MIAMWLVSAALAARVEIVVLNPDEVAAAQVGGFAAAFGSVFTDLPAKVSSRIAERVGGTLAEKGLTPLVLVDVGAVEWLDNEPVVRVDSDGVTVAHVAGGAYTAIVVEVPDPIAVARHEKGAVAVFIGRMIGMRVKKVTLETLAIEIAAGLVGGGVEAAITYRLR